MKIPKGILYKNYLEDMTNGQKDIQFSTETLQRAEEIIARYPEGKHKSALIPLLHLAQDEFGGWLSPEVMNYVASILKIQKY